MNYFLNYTEYHTTQLRRKIIAVALAHTYKHISILNIAIKFFLAITWNLQMENIQVT